MTNGRPAVGRGGGSDLVVPLLLLLHDFDLDRN